jgi:DNA-binding XRE family transcriptional regulator
MSGATYALLADGSRWLRPADDPIARAERLVVDGALDTIPGEFPFDRLVDGIRETRIALGLSQAKAARLAGLSAQRVGGLERGQSRGWWSAVKLRTALTLLELSAPLEDFELVMHRVDRAVGDALAKQTKEER